MMRRYLPLLFIFITIVNAQQRANTQRRPVNTQQRPVSQSPAAKSPKQVTSGGLSSMRDLDFEVLKLSYIQTDRALAILKTMGYAVVEYKSGKGEIDGEYNFTPTYTNKANNLNAVNALPIVIKLPDTETISLVKESKSKSTKKSALGVDLGGVTLDYTTSGDPMQRLLVAYKPGDFNSVAKLIDIIQNKIDVPANQIAIEALVLEINNDRLDELGIDFSNAGQGYSATFPPPESGSISPFTVGPR